MTVPVCACRCHITAGADCTLAGPNSENGRPYCGPHTDTEIEQITAQRRATQCVLPHPKLAPGQTVERFLGLLCRRHYHWISSTLDEILTLWALLPDVADQHGSTDVKVAISSVHSPAPGRLDYAAFTDNRVRATPVDLEPGDIPNVPGTLQTWVATVLKDRGVVPPRWAPPRASIVRPAAPVEPARMAGPLCDVECEHHTCRVIRLHDQLHAGQLARYQHVVEHLATERRAGDWTWRGSRWTLPDDVASLVRILKREAKWIAAQEWVPDYCDELVTVHRVLAGAVGESMWARPLGLCPNCSRPIYVEAGVDAITCRRCKSSWEGVHYLRLRLMLEKQGAH